MYESTDWLKQEVVKIENWEKDQSDLWFWEKLGRLPFKLIDKLTPRFIQNKIGTILDELGQYLQTGGSYLSSVSSLSTYYPDAHIQTIEEAALLPISTMDEAVLKLTKTRKKAATIQGASTGIGGFFTITIDIPVLLGLQLKTLQDIAMCYGYDPKDKKERLFIVKCLQFVSADIVGKQAILKQITNTYDEQKAKREALSEIQGWREVVYSYRDQFGWKKLFQMVPIAGMIFGAFTNRSSINDIAEAGMMFYRKRRIIDRLSTDTLDKTENV